MAGLSATGFDAKSLEDIETEIKEAFWADISPTLNLSATSLLGQYVGSTSSQLRQVWEAAQASYAARDIEQATGSSLTELCALTGTIRRAPTYSTVLMNVTLTAAGGSPAGTYAAGSLRVYPIGSPGSAFTNDEDVIAAVDDTYTDVPFSAEETGPVRAEASTMTVIANPVSGFLSCNNPLSAVLGANQETNPALRARQRLELARRGSSTVDAMRTDISDELGDATFVAVLENDTDVTVDGIPPHSVECIIQSGDTDAVIARAVFNAKPAGVRAYGSTTVLVYDSMGNSRTIGFTAPTTKLIVIELTVTILSASYLGDDAVKEAITDWTSVNLTVGADVLKARIESLALGVTGVLDASALIGLDGGPPAVAANYVIGDREIADVTTGNITITQVIVNGPP